MKRGSLIIFEGVDRCGKTTQVKKLSEKLTENGHSIYTTRFPERTSEIGQMINAYLKNTSNLSDQAIGLKKNQIWVILFYDLVPVQN